MLLLKNLFARIGKNVIFDPDGIYSFSTIELGNDVFIGLGAHFSGQHIVIEDKVMFGPGVYILGGDHQYSEIGKFMYQLKAPGKSLPVIIEEDVWIGARVIILKGVRIGTGSIVGAGSVVTHNINPYSIVAGNPARLLRYRFEKNDLKRHLNLLKAQPR